MPLYPEGSLCRPPKQLFAVGLILCWELQPQVQPASLIGGVARKSKLASDLGQILTQKVMERNFAARTFLSAKQKYFDISPSLPLLRSLAVNSVHIEICGDG